MSESYKDINKDSGLNERKIDRKIKNIQIEKLVVKLAETNL